MSIKTLILRIIVVDKLNKTKKKKRWNWKILALSYNNVWIKKQALNMKFLFVLKINYTQNNFPPSILKQNAILHSCCQFSIYLKIIQTVWNWSIHKNIICNIFQEDLNVKFVAPDSVLTSTYIFFTLNSLALHKLKNYET